MCADLHAGPPGARRRRPWFRHSTAFGFRPRFFLRVGGVDLRKDAAAALYIYVCLPVPGRVWLDVGSLQSHQPLKCLLPLPHRFQLPSAQRKGP